MIIKPEYNKKSQMAELVHRRLSGGDVNKDSSWDKREIELHIENALNQIMRVSVLENSQMGDKSIGGQYIATFENIPIQFNPDREIAYIEVPAKYIALPYDRGLYSISPMKASLEGFIPVRNGSQNFTSLHEVPYLQGRTGFMPEGDRAIFVGKEARQTYAKMREVGNVLVRLVVAADGDKIAVNVPADIEFNVIEQVYRSLANRQVEDKVNDNLDQR